MNKNYKKNCIFLTLSLFSISLFAQSIDTSLLNQLSPEQIEMAKDVYNKDNSTDVDIENLPLIDESLVNITNQDFKNSSSNKYGYDFFSTKPTSLTAVGDLPLPNDYKISLRDQFTVILSGSKDAIFNLNVKLDGTILFPELGSISVVGLTLGEVKNKLSKMINQSYIGVNIDVSLQNLSAKKITIVGAVNTPGTYLVNPFSTITGALAYSGGILEIGSLRNIKLIRNNGDEFYFDLYDLLIKGDRSNDITIEAGDTILIGAASQFVEISGAVKRPATYELLKNETVENLVDFALGFTNTANKTNISLSYIDLEANATVKKTVDNLEESLKNVFDVDVFSYVNNLKSSIQVIGAVEEPGFYDLDKYDSIKDLINDLKFVDVYPWLAVIEQFDEDNLIKSSELFSLKDEKTFSSIKLLPNSKVYFLNRESQEIEVDILTRQKIDEFTLTINHKGVEYKMPVYGYFNVESFVRFLGIDMSDIDEVATYISPLDSFVLTQNFKEMRFESKKFHTVSFRSPINDLITVSITGAIDYPGTYTLESNASLNDLYSLIGSFKPEAYLKGIVFTRETIRNRQLRAIEKSKEDLNESILTSLQKGENLTDVNLIVALSENIEPEYLGRIAGDFQPNSSASISTVLLDGDSIFIPKNPNAINVLGEVLNPIAFQYEKGIKVKDAINFSGGYKDYAARRKVYVIKANGVIEKNSRNIFVKDTKLEPGDTIVVPRKIITQSPGVQALIPITQILSDMAFSAAAIESLSNSNR